MPWRAFTVTTTPQKAAEYNKARHSLSLFNNGTGIIFFSQNPSDGATQGFPLNPGATVTLIEEDGDEPEGDLYVVTTVGTQDLRVQEGDVKPR